MSGQPPGAPWRVVYFKRDRRDDPAETRPGRAFLAAWPTNVATRLIAFLDAVKDAPPPQFSGGGMWESMHNEMAGYYEVRTRARKQLYRLFCVLEHRQPGLPSLTARSSSAHGKRGPVSAPPACGRRQVGGPRFCPGRQVGGERLAR